MSSPLLWWLLGIPFGGRASQSSCGRPGLAPFAVARWLIRHGGSSHGLTENGRRAVPRARRSERQNISADHASPGVGCSFLYSRVKTALASSPCPTQQRSNSNSPSISSLCSRPRRARRSCGREGREGWTGWRRACGRTSISRPRTLPRRRSGDGAPPSAPSSRTAAAASAWWPTSTAAARTKHAGDPSRYRSSPMLVRSQPLPL